MAGKGKVIKSGTMTPVRGGGGGKVGKQGGATNAVSGRVSIPGNKSGGGKFAKGGPSGKVGKQGGSIHSKPGVVTTSGR
jgi:hypothetical protein